MKAAANRDGTVNFARVLKKVIWCLVTEGSISYRRMGARKLRSCPTCGNTPRNWGCR